MACCGGGSAPIRVKQHVKAAVVPRPVRTLKTTSASNITKKSVRSLKNKCPSCGYPMILVNIAGRDRYQCSNVNCRNVM